MDKPLAGGYKQDDSLEAILALNIGDFILEHFISEDLLGKINTRIAEDSQKLMRQLEELMELYSVEKTLGILGGVSRPNGSEGVTVSYDNIALTLKDLFQVDACHLFLKNPSADPMGESHLVLLGTSVQPAPASYESIFFSTQGSNILLQPYLGSQPVVLEPQGKDRLNWHPMEALNQQTVQTLMAVPLAEGRKPLGLLLLESYSARSFGSELKELATATAQTFVTASRLHQLLLATRDEVSQFAGDTNELVNLRAQITENIADLGIHQQEFLQALSHAVDARHEFSQGHSQHVARIARAVAEAMELNEKTIDLVYYAGLLSALGKLSIPDALMAKSDSLTESERVHWHNHPQAGASLLSRIHFLSEVIPYVYTYQERWDGTGGPEGLSGRSIPLGSRILAVADGYYAMTQERPYRGEALSHHDALAVLQREAGSKWDPAVVDAFSKISPDAWM